MPKYIIHYKEKGRDWSQTSYTSPEPVTRDYLIEFFGLDKEDIENFIIEQEDSIWKNR